MKNLILCLCFGLFLQELEAKHPKLIIKKALLKKGLLAGAVGHGVLPLPVAIGGRIAGAGHGGALATGLLLKKKAVAIATVGLGAKLIAGKLIAGKVAVAKIAKGKALLKTALKKRKAKKVKKVVALRAPSVPVVSGRFAVSGHKGVIQDYGPDYVEYDGSYGPYSY